MIYSPGEVQAGIETLPGQGYARVQDAIDPALFLREAHFSEESFSLGWEGVEPNGGSIEDLPGQSPNTRALSGELGKIASAAGYPEWEANRFMFNITTEGYPWHPDRTSFQDFVVLTYLLGRTEMVLQAGDEKPRGLVMNPGDMLLVGAGTRHGVKETRLRGFLGLVHDKPDPGASWLLPRANQGSHR